MEKNHVQIGGNHYSVLKYDVMEFGYDVGLDGNVYNLLKYATRHPFKNKIEDLKKAASYLNFLVRMRDEGRLPKTANKCSDFDEKMDRFVSQFVPEVKDIMEAIINWQWAPTNLHETIIRGYLAKCDYGYCNGYSLRLIAEKDG